MTHASLMLDVAPDDTILIGPTTRSLLPAMYKVKEYKEIAGVGLAHQLLVSYRCVVTWNSVSNSHENQRETKRPRYGKILMHIALYAELRLPQLEKLIWCGLSFNLVNSDDNSLSARTKKAASRCQIKISRHSHR